MRGLTVGRTRRANARERGYDGNGDEGSYQRLLVHLRQRIHGEGGGGEGAGRREREPGGNTCANLISFIFAAILSSRFRLCVQHLSALLNLSFQAPLPTFSFQITMSAPQQQQMAPRASAEGQLSTSSKVANAANPPRAPFGDSPMESILAAFSPPSSSLFNLAPFAFSQQMCSQLEQARALVPRIAV